MAYTYSDIDLSFQSHPSTHDILKRFDVDAAKFWLKNLMMTNPGENLNDMHYGVGVSRLQFELMTPILKSFVKRKITNQVYQYLPEVSIQNLSVDDNLDTGEIRITIEYFVQGSVALQKYSMILVRMR